MLPQLVHSVCSNALRTALAGASVSALASIQLPWGLVQQLHTHAQAHACWPSLQQHQQLQHFSQQQCREALLQTRHLPCQLAASRFLFTSAPTCEKQLKDIMKLERLQHATADAVEEIWMEFHAPSTTHIATVLSKDEHTILCARAAASPLFVMPLSKKPGSFQTLLLQWQPPHRLLFTTLEEFKQWGPQAPPHLTVQLFDDLKDSHGLVLARGDLINPQLISAPEGRTLLELARAFYRDAAAYRRVYAFNHQPDQFDFQQLCRELNIGVQPQAAAGLTPPAQA